MSRWDHKTKPLDFLLHFNIIGKEQHRVKTKPKYQEMELRSEVCAWLSLSCVGNFAKWLTAFVPHSESQQHWKIITGINLYVCEYILSKNYGTSMIFSKTLWNISFSFFVFFLNVFFMYLCVCACACLCVCGRCVCGSHGIWKKAVAGTWSHATGSCEPPCWCLGKDLDPL